jgi:hypothetical protein
VLPITPSRKGRPENSNEVVGSVRFAWEHLFVGPVEHAKDSNSFPLAYNEAGRPYDRRFPVGYT